MARKSSFFISKREAQFGKINPRNERHGEEKKLAIDIPVKIAGTKTTVDMIIPHLSGEKISSILYDEKGIHQFPHLRHFKVDRDPGDCHVTIFDQATARGTPLVFPKSHIKDIEIEFAEKKVCEIRFKVQTLVDADSELPRLAKLMDNDREIEIESSQKDAFADLEEEEEEEEGQGDMLGGDGDEEEEEEEEDDED